MKKITVEDMTCGFCGIKGHTSRSCSKKKEAEQLEEMKSKKESRKKSKRYSFGDNKNNKPLLALLTNEGKDALLNGRMMYSSHFTNPVKPETAVCETLIEPFFKLFDKSNSDYLVESSREPTFTTVSGKKRHLDYLLTVTQKTGTKNFKWLVEAEAPNRSHKGMEQVEEFIDEVPNINEYGFIVTDGFHFHITDNTNEVIEWEHYTIKELRKLLNRMYRITTMDKIKYGLTAFGAIALMTYAYFSL